MKFEDVAENGRYVFYFEIKAIPEQPPPQGLLQ